MEKNYYELNRTFALYKNFLSFKKGDYSINNSELEILIYICVNMQDREVNSVMLSEVFKCSKAYITKVLNALEQAGMIYRENNPKDKRSNHIIVTDAGITVAESAIFEFDEISRKIVTGLGEEKASTLKTLLQEAATFIIV